MIAVYTQPDKKGKRKSQTRTTPGKRPGRRSSNIPVFQPHSLKDEEEQQALTNLKADIMVVVAYGMLLPKADTRYTSPGVHQRPRFYPSTLARCSTGSSAQCSKVTRKQVLPLCRWMKVSIPVICYIKSFTPISQTDTIPPACLNV